MVWCQQLSLPVIKQCLQGCNVLGMQLFYSSIKRLLAHLPGIHILNWNSRPHNSGELVSQGQQTPVCKHSISPEQWLTSAPETASRMSEHQQQQQPRSSID